MLRIVTPAMATLKPSICVRVPTTGVKAAIPPGRVFMQSSKTTSSGQRKLFQFKMCIRDSP